MSRYDHFKANHRCEDSIKANCRILKGHRHYRNDNEWHLFAIEYDFDFMAYAESHVAEIQYCPFCGKKLEE